MASHRGEHATRTDKDVPYTNSLPLVSIREPYQWMQSMCRHTYTAKWPHLQSHCPDLIATEEDMSEFDWLQSMYWDSQNNSIPGLEHLVPVSVKYAENLRHNHKSLAHFWSEWYREYMDADYPRIMVRFEDLLFYGKEVTESKY